MRLLSEARERGKHGPETTKPPEFRGFVSVDTVRGNSNKSALLPPGLRDLEKLATLAASSADPTADVSPPAWRLGRRLSGTVRSEIVAKYRAGTTTPALCAEYSLSKGGLLKLLRDSGVQLRNQPLTSEQLIEAASMYEQGGSIASIAGHFGVSYNGVRQAFVRAGTERRPRGGSKSRA